MAKKVYCPTCGEQISADAAFCEFCGSALDPDELEVVDEEDSIPEYTDIDDSLYEEIDGKIIKVNLPLNKTVGELANAEKGTFPTTTHHAVGVYPNTTSGSPTTSSVSPSDTSYQPADMSKAIHLSSEESDAKENTSSKEQQKPYEANADHYWDDIRPEIEDVIKENKLDIIIKIVGSGVLVILLIIYLIFFLPSF